MKTFLRMSALGLFAAALLNCGPTWAAGPAADDYGNYITSSDYDSAIPTGLFLDISGTGTLIASDDDSGDSVVIPFAFPFYGVGYTTIGVSTNGFISFGSDTAYLSDFINGSLPQTDIPVPAAFAYHDDIEAMVYGQYFDQASSSFGTEMYVAQWDACHWSCTPGSDPTVVQFNMMLLRDGTIIMPFNLVSSEAGSQATIGIQSGGGAAADSASYLYDEGVMTDGMTIVVFAPTSTQFGRSFNGLGDDMNIAANELGAIQTRSYAAGIRNVVAGAFSEADGDMMTTASVGRIPSGSNAVQGLGFWGRAYGMGITGDFGPSVRGHNAGLQTGMDRLFGNGFLGGISVGYAHSRIDIGALTVAGDFYTVEPYLAARLDPNWTATASVSYTYADYDRISNPLLTAEADGHRFAASFGLDGSYVLPAPGWTLIPSLTLTTGAEDIGEWAGAAFSGAASSTRFFTAEATLKAEKRFVTGSGSAGKFYGLAGFDFVDTNGDNTVALFAANYRTSRFGGVAGAGVQMQLENGASFNAEVKAKGIGADATVIGGSLSLRKTF